MIILWVSSYCAASPVKYRSARAKLGNSRSLLGFFVRKAECEMVVALGKRAPTIVDAQR